MSFAEVEKNGTHSSRKACINILLIWRLQRIVFKRRAFRGNGKAREQPKTSVVRRKHIKEYKYVNAEKKHEQREKEVDTFQDDEFYDRTLEKKEELNLDTIRREVVGETTEDYWRVKNKLEELLLRRRDLNKQLVECATRTYEPVEEDDEYEKYMNSMEDKLKTETRGRLAESIKLND